MYTMYTFFNICELFDYFNLVKLIITYICIT